MTVKSDKKEDEKTETKQKTKQEVKREDLSEDDKKLQNELNLLVQKLTEPDTTLYKPALEGLRSEIRSSTTSMTSVPKPLKFLRPHYATIKDAYEKITETAVKELCADVISILAMTMGTDRECLKFRTLGSQEPVGTFGHEYVRHLAAELGEQWRLQEDRQRDATLDALICSIVEHHMTHNAEAEAVDLLMELERLELLPKFVDEHSQPRVCLYLISCVPYVPDPDNSLLLQAALEIYLKFGKRIEALRTAVMLNDRELMLKILIETTDTAEQKQMAILLGRQQVFLDVPEDVPYSKDLSDLISNTTLSQNFLSLARELDITEPKHPDEIYKAHLEQTRTNLTSQQLDSARKNLANAVVNGLVNCGFGSDKIVANDENWFYKHKDLGILTAAASHGLIHRWDIENGLVHIDKYLYSNEDNIKAGSLLAVGLISSGVQHECDPAAALLLDYILHEKNVHRIGSVLGLGIAYANSSRSSVSEQVVPGLLKVLDDPKSSSEVLGLTGLSLGLICVGTGKLNAEIAMRLWELLTEKKDINMDSNFRWIALGISLIYLGRQEDGTDIMLESLKALPSPYCNFAATLFEACAYAGSGNVLKVQQMLHICSTHLAQTKDKDEKAAASSTEKKSSGKDSSKETTAATTASGSSKKTGGGSSTSNNNNGAPDLPDGWLEQAVAVLGIALIAGAEDVGSSMSFRIFGNLLRYGDVWVRRIVPLALALTSVSNPQLTILEALSKFSHDPDSETACNSIMALGIVGAGTNNARLGAMLRQLAAFHQRDPSTLFLVRIAQGLTHMGKGTLSLHPYHFDRQLLCLPSLAALLSTAFAFLDVKNTILGKQHYLLYTIVPAIQPRMLLTFKLEEDELKPVYVPVRVGQAVDVVGQAGRPKTITGFQTHTTPVLLAYGERAELATEDYTSVTPVMEGFVILKPTATAKMEH